MTTSETSRFPPFPKRHETLVGIDSDGCVFDTMEVKQREHFLPLILRFWELERIAALVATAQAFVNLHSRWRGRNRFTNLLLLFELLADWPEVRAAGVPLPDLAALRVFCASGLPLGNPALRDWLATHPDGELRRVLAWSLAINADIDARMRPVAPFDWALRSLDRIAAASDALVVSQTPEAALLKEWRLHGLENRVTFIAGQERGDKCAHLRLAAAGRYAPGRMLMIGDAPGDQQAAQEAGALFYPILPGAEEASWERFHGEAYARFLAGTYDRDYATALAVAFEAALPATPPWQRRG